MVKENFKFVNIDNCMFRCYYVGRNDNLLLLGTISRHAYYYNVSAEPSFCKDYQQSIIDNLDYICGFHTKLHAAIYLFYLWQTFNHEAIYEANKCKE